MIRLVLIILFLFSTVSASFAKTIILGAENDWVPYSNHDGSGMANEIVLAAYKAVGIDVKLQVAPYNRLLKMVKSGVFPKAQYYVDKLDEALAIIKANGTYKKIVDAY